MINKFLKKPGKHLSLLGKSISFVLFLIFFIYHNLSGVPTINETLSLILGCSFAGAIFGIVDLSIFFMNILGKRK